MDITRTAEYLKKILRVSRESDYLAEIFSIISEYFSPEAGFMAVYSDYAGRYIPKKGYNLSDESIKKIEEPKENFFLNTASGAKPVSITNPDKAYLGKLFGDEPVSGDYIIFRPVIFKDKVLAIILFLFKEELTDEAKALFDIFAEEAATVAGNIQRMKSFISLTEMSIALNSTLVLDEVLSISVAAIHDIIGAGSVRTFLRDSAEEDYFREVPFPGIELPASEEDILPADPEAVNYLLKHSGPILLSETKDIKIGDKIRDLLIGKNAEVFAPIVTNPLVKEGRVLGFFLIGKKKNSSPYTQDEKHFIAPFFSQIAMSVENARLYRGTTTDGLTGLFNHQYFYIHMEEELRKFRRYQRPLSLIMLDIDHFKQFNDTYGHQRGDIALKEVSETLRKSVRDIDIVCRYGGEEFAVILPETPLEKAVAVAERIRAHSEEKEIAFSDKQKVRVTLSLGVAEYPSGGKISVKEFVDAADGALYIAKNYGRNRVEISK